MNHFKFLRRYNWLLLAAYLTSAAAAPGCATRSHSVTTRTDGAAGSSSTVTVSDEGSRGVVGSAFHLVGQVLIFPFKVIGSLFS